MLPHIADCAPVTKGLMTLMVLLSITVNIPLSAFRPWFQITPRGIFELLQVTTKELDLKSQTILDKDCYCKLIRLF